MTQLLVTGGSLAADPLSRTWSDKLAEHGATMPGGSGALIGELRPRCDGDDLVVFYSVQFTDQHGTRYRASVTGIVATGRCRPVPGVAEP